MNREPKNLHELFKDFYLLVLEAKQLLLENLVEDFLIHHEGYSLKEAKAVSKLTYGDLINEAEKYALELKWYVKNNKGDSFNKITFMKMIFYRRRSLSGLSALKKDMDSTRSDVIKNALAILLDKFVNLFNESLAAARVEILETETTDQSGWVDLYELNTININDL
jgi:hypothetical protein